MDNSKEIKFTCPKCNGQDIEEVMVDVGVTSEVSILWKHDDGGVDMSYGDQTNHDGYVERYQCSGCGYTIVSDAPEFDELTEDGLNEDALVKAIEKLNPPQSNKNILVDMHELGHLLVANFNSMPGELMADTWNELFDEQVVYEGDSMFRFKVKE